MLTCTCPEYSGEPGTWFFYGQKDFEKFPTKRRKRCCSCKALINQGADCLRFERWRGPSNDIEDKIYGDDGEIRIADWFMCEQCGEIYMNLTDIGYCVMPNEHMEEYLKEYWEITGFTPRPDSSGPAA